jgi:hypothetical protein
MPPEITMTDDLASRRAQMFPVLPTAAAARAAAFGVEKAFPAGAIVWDQGDEHIPFYIVLEGKL